MKRNKNNQTLKEVIGNLVDQYRLNGKLNEVKVVNMWSLVVGRSVDNHTTKLYMRNGVLFVHLDSSVVRQELQYSKQRIMDQINSQIEVEGNVISDIVFR